MKVKAIEKNVKIYLIMPKFKRKIKRKKDKMMIYMFILEKRSENYNGQFMIKKLLT